MSMRPTRKTGRPDRLVSILLLLAACGSPEPRPPEENLALSSAWRVSNSTGARATLSPDESGGLRIDYVTPGFGGWINLERPFDARLDSGAAFILERTGTRGTAVLEFKVIPSDGGVYGVRLEMNDTPGSSRIGRDQLEYWPWNGEAGSLDRVQSLAIAIAAPGYETGFVVIRSLHAEGVAMMPRSAPFAPFAVAALSDDEVLEEVERRTVAYFWDTADTQTGVAIDHEGNRSVTLGKTAATGFGLAAICLGIERGWIPREAGYERVLTTLRFFDNRHGPDGWVKTSPDRPRAEGRWGLWYHFIHRKTGAWDGSDCVAICDSADLVAGIIVCRSYFKGTEIEALATEMLDAIEWDKFLLPPDRQGRVFLSMGYVPKGGSVTHRMLSGGFLGPAVGLCDNSLLFYFMAMGSKTHPIPVKAWESYVSTYIRGSYAGCTTLVAPQSFCRQVPLSFMGLRGWKDRGVDYFGDLAWATKAQRAYGIGSKHYDENLWGFDDCLGYPGGGYTHGGPPGRITDDGTVATAGFAASTPFLPGPCIAAIRSVIERFGDRVFGPHGFTSSLALEKNFFCPFAVGIEAGPIVNAVANHRDGFVWRYFTGDAVGREAIRRIGFVPLIDDFELPAEAPPNSAWSVEEATIAITPGGVKNGERCLAIRPLPGAARVTLEARPFPSDRSGFPVIRCDLRDVGRVTAVLVDSRGREVPARPAGTGSGADGWKRCSFLVGDEGILAGAFRLRFVIEEPGVDAAIDEVVLTRR